ncbi:MAG: hypothetical protein JJU05_01660 [Verrucomicrobia bacterium]|nr:hypothetical protein [Verrucomicrobiota bacterium]MCH8529001.1 hypothetical protein [Kiritimatiellia bacterium]
MRKIQFLIMIVVCAGLLGSHRADAGEGGRLRRFESQTAAKRPPRVSNPQPVSAPSKNEEPSVMDELLLDLFVRPLAFGMLAGGAYGLELSGNRMAGDPIFPLARLDAGVQYISSDITAYGYGVELGQAIIAADFRHTYYNDRLFDDTLHFYQFHALYRMGFGPRVETNLALGGMWLRGEESASAFSVGLPVRYWPSRRLGAEVRPMFGFFEAGTLYDLEAGFLLRYEHGALRLGYRWVESQGERLSGPRIGFSFRF